MNLEERVENLERENRRLRLTGIVVLTALSGTVLLGALRPQQIQTQIRASSFELVDSEGRTRGFLGERKTATGEPTGVATLALLDVNGTKQAELYEGGLLVFGDGASGALLGPTRLVFEDHDGVPRASIGRVDINTLSTGAETTCPAAVVLFDADGNVIWQAPC